MNFLIFVLFISFNGYSQITNNGVVISNDTTAKCSNFLMIHSVKGSSKIKLKEGKFIEVQFKNKKKTIEGEYYIVNDSTIKIDEKLINLNSIRKIRTTNSKNIKAGRVMLGISSVLIIGGVLSVGVGTNQNETFPSFLFIGTGVIEIVTGIILLPISAALINNKKYNSYNSNIWDYSIELLQINQK